MSARMRPRTLLFMHGGDRNLNGTDAVTGYIVHGDAQVVFAFVFGVLRHADKL